MAENFKAITIGKYGDPTSIAVRSISIPDVPEGFVLIRTEFASIHPADEHIYKEGQPFKFNNNTLGLQGSGTVIKSGGGVLANSFLNKRVTFGSFGEKSSGSWAEYALAATDCVIPIMDSFDFEQAASAIYAMTVELMMRKIRKGNHRAIIQNAAAGYIGKTLIKYCNYLGIATINIVRRDDQVSMLKDLGAKYVINSSDEGWKERVRDLARSLKATIAFDAVAGEMTEDLYELLVGPGVLYVYGFLSGQPCLINPMSLANDKKIKGLLLFD